ncbi:hypothetical protein SAMN05216553_10527 [Lentzea fradiae]|uniref:Uncharacterized protein n=1 Tax=Lentzea fradiae TaxID=200378 RepID=A0A1G7QZX1_9PSEU|nr:hypothetical protein [Lentzea fradiae]SDG04071.1 hypothetical protein SAMN05216553_10527 [Lentzea fradiae]
MTERNRLLWRRVLLICGLIASAAGVYAWTSFSEDLMTAGPQGVIALIVAISVVVWLWGGEDDSLVPKEFVNLPVGIGTLRSMKRTTLEVNGVPQYDVTFDVATAQGARFTGTQRILLDREIVEELHPGLELPVHHRVDGRTDVAMAFDVDGEDIDLTRLAVQVAQGSLSPELADVARRGLRTKAEVVSFEPTGAIRAGQAVVIVGLRVRRPDGSTFDHVSEKLIGAEELPYLRPGCIVGVRYLPEREDLVVTAVVVPQRGTR